MKENNAEKIKKLLEAEPLPEELSADSMKRMLDEKAPKKKRKKISRTVGRATAVAASCAVVCGLGVHFAERKKDDDYIPLVMQQGDSSTAITPSTGTELIGSAGYTNKANDYSEIYSMFEASAEKYDEYYHYTNGVVLEDAEMAVDGAVDVEADGSSESIPTVNLTNDNSNKDDFYETYNQEQGVSEADICKTDGERIYYLKNQFLNYGLDKPLVAVADVNDGEFEAVEYIEIADDLNLDIIKDNDRTVEYKALDMYLYNDMIIIIGTASEYMESSADDYDTGVYNDSIIYGGLVEYVSFVSVYTVGSDPEPVGFYTQDGQYKDVRITPEGYLYLITSYNSRSFSQIKDEDEIEAYIPSYGTGNNCDCVAADDIFIPECGLSGNNVVSYTVVGSLDLNNNEDVVNKDVKALAGYTGNIYCSEKNLYTVSNGTESVITRISIEDGMIDSAAEGKINGRIKDQFSMSEHNGYFRVAATYESWQESFTEEVASYSLSSIENYVYVLDMDLKVVSRSECFGKGENIKSVSFSGDLAYVVTFMQTDPLYSIDLSNPEKPVILDEYKLPGYSSYMQSWGEGLLLGFGANADELGNESGLKLVMFDNSDPNNLKELDSYVIETCTEDAALFSQAMSERKALIIAPEKNLIGIPLSGKMYRGEKGSFYMGYHFFSYENGSFKKVGEIAETENGDMYVNQSRALYIGDYIYVITDNKFISADIATLTKKSELAIK